MILFKLYVTAQSRRDLVTAKLTDGTCTAPVLLFNCYVCPHACLRLFIQVYVCAAFLGTWQRDVLGLEFQELMMFLQKLPTGEWGEPNMEVILSNAYVLRNTWGNAQSHMQS
jgi:hypothetical protein